MVNNYVEHYYNNPSTITPSNEGKTFKLKSSSNDGGSYTWRVNPSNNIGDGAIGMIPDEAISGSQSLNGISNPTSTDDGVAAGAAIGGKIWTRDATTGEMVATGTTDGSTEQYYDYSGDYKAVAYGSSGTTTSTGGSQGVVASSEGITQASQSLLNCSSELSELFDNILQITNSIGTNLTGFSEVEELIAGLKQINSAKDNLISKINEFGNYLTSTVTTGYDSFMNALGSIDIDTSFLTTLASLFGVKLGTNSFGNTSGITQQETKTGVANRTGSQSSNNNTTGNKTSNGTIKGSSNDNEIVSNSLDSVSEQDMQKALDDYNYADEKYEYWKDLASDPGNNAYESNYAKQQMEKWSSKKYQATEKAGGSAELSEYAYKQAQQERLAAQTEYFNNPTAENRAKYNQAILDENNARIKSEANN